MNRFSLGVPDHVNFLSEWTDFWDKLPKGKHFILDKKVCGCGATEAYLRSDQKVILAAPRKQLLHNKYKQHLSDSYHLFRYDGDDDLYFDQKDRGTADAIQGLDSYLKTTGKKILVTYDSLKYVQEVLSKCGENLDDWTVVVDEFQVIFHDCVFKATTEYDFSVVVKKFSNVVYISATPMMDKYLNKTIQFKDLDLYELAWSSNRIITPYVEVKHYRKNIKTSCEEIIEDYRGGKGKSIVIPNQPLFVSTEAVFFLNNVKDIMSIIKSKNMRPEEVNIIISKNSANDNELVALNKALGLTGKNKHKVGIIPKKGEPHKRFTFCTSTVYVGADFYSTCAYTYVFANPEINSMALDISIDLQQIIGRQRLETNPFRNSATLYFCTSSDIISQEDFEEMIKSKNQATVEHIANFEAAPFPGRYLNFIKNSNDRDSYCTVSEPINGITTEATLVKNDLIEISDMRSWEIYSNVYKSDLSLYCALATSGLSTSLNNSIPMDILQEWNKDGSFERKAKLYCDLADQDLLGGCIFIDTDFHNCYEALGREGMERLGWHSGRIHDALNPLSQKDYSNVEYIANCLRERFKENSVYPKTKIKKYLDNIYASSGIKGTPKSSDIEDYMSVKSTTDKKNGVVVSSYKILSHYRDRVSLFDRITNITKPDNKYTVDGILNLIKSGKYFNLKERIELIHNTTDQDKKNLLKISLPAVCWNGTFKSRNKAMGDKYSSFIALDFDHVQDMDSLKKMLETKAYVYAYFVTPSGEGLKAIILHDNYLGSHHGSLYKSLLDEFTNWPELDKSVVDFARAHFLSYDPDLWKNPAPVPFAYDYTKGEAKAPEGPGETICEIFEAGSSVKVERVIKDGLDIDLMLYEISNFNRTDETIIRMFRQKWTGRSLVERGRNNTAMSYLGVLCKAGVDKTKAQNFVESLIPGFDISQIIEYSYTHNVFGCSRRRLTSRG